MAIAPARRVAFDVLLRVEVDGAYSAEALHAPGSAFHLSALDRALCMQLVMGVLRWQGRLDAAIARHTKTGRLDAEVLIALRMATFQLGFLERIPPSAAVNDSVELVKRARKRSAAPLVNAVLRKLVKEADMLPPGAGPYASAPELASNLAHPEWLVTRWVEAFGSKVAEAICRHDQSLPPITVRLDSEEVETSLVAEGMVLAPGALMRNARVVVSGDLQHTRTFTEGGIAIQDEASQLVAAMIGRGEHILDCCAAPGGKTRAIAAHNPAATVIAAELHPHRARTMQRIGLPNNVTVIAADAQSLPLATTFDRVLADVPCSGSGTLARNPEIKWRLTPADLDDLQRRQKEILHAALDRLAPGGRLIYSTCSLERTEDEDVVHAVLVPRPEFSLVPAVKVLEEIGPELVWPDPTDLVRGDFLRTLPGIHPCDGFFAAVLVRN